MDSFSAYSYGTSSWLALQAVPLIVSPTIINTMLSSDLHQLSSLEEYFSRSLGLTLLTLSLLCIILTGAFPLVVPSSDLPSENAPPANLYATPTLIITLIYHCLTAFYGYARYTRSGQSAFLLGAMGSGALAGLGVWCMMFAGGSRISKRTGADKRTSGFPFGNREADKKKLSRKRL